MKDLSKFIVVLSVTIFLGVVWTYTNGKAELAKQHATVITNVRPDGFVEFSNGKAVCFSGSKCETMNLGN